MALEAVYDLPAILAYAFAATVGMGSLPSKEGCHYWWYWGAIDYLITGAGDLYCAARDGRVE